MGGGGGGEGKVVTSELCSKTVKKISRPMQGNWWVTLSVFPL